MIFSNLIEFLLTNEGILWVLLLIVLLIGGVLCVMVSRKHKTIDLTIEILIKSNHWVVVIDKNNIITHLSENVAEYLGLKTADIIGKRWDTDLAELMRKSEEEEIIEVNKSVNCRKYSLKSGGFIWIEWTTVIHPEYHIISIGKDITLHKESEIRLRQSDLIKRTLLDNFPGYVVCKDIHGRFLFVNRAMAELMGKPENEIVGLTDRDYGASEADVLRYQATDREVIETGLPLFIPEQSVLKKDGTPGVFQTSKFPLPFEKDKQTAVLVIDIDISNLKHTEAALIKTQQKITYKSNILLAIGKTTEKLLTTQDVEATLAENIALIGEAAMVDRAYYFEKNHDNDFVSQRIEWTKGNIKPEINNPQLQNLDTSIYPDFIYRLKAGKPYIVVTAQLGEHEAELKELLASQDIISMLNIPVSVNGVFYGFIGFDDCTTAREWTEDELSLLISLANNIANAFERNAIQRKIIESEHNFREINETIDDVFWLYDIENQKIDYISPSCEQVLGFNQTYFYQNHKAWQSYVFPEDIEKVQQAHLDIETKGSYEVEYRIRIGNEQRWIFEKSFAITNEKGKVVRNSGVCVDVTEKILKQQELSRLLEITHKQNDRLTNFAHIISHNIRSHSSNLSSLMTFINETQQPEEKEMYMILIHKSIDKLAETIQNLNEIITIQNNKNLEKVEMNLKSEINTTIHALGAQIQSTGAEIVNEVSENILIDAIPAYMESILLNFLSNALKYRSPHRKPHITFDAVKQGHYWLLTIADNGLGIDLEKHGHKIFGMYKTFHNHPEAKGIGLFIAKNQIEAMDGKIEVKSTVGEGTTFYIYFYAEN